jgi:hypothetical protein
MGRVLAVLALALSTLAACGLAGTGAAGAAGGNAEVQQAADARKTEERARQEVDQAFKKAAEQRQNAETQAQ